MISSAALPNVALSSPPTPAPRRAARDSVASPISPASGTIASAANAKVAIPPQWSAAASGARATKTSSRRSARPGSRERARRGAAVAVMARHSARARGREARAPARWPIPGPPMPAVGRPGRHGRGGLRERRGCPMHARCIAATVATAGLTLAAAGCASKSSQDLLPGAVYAASVVKVYGNATFRNVLGNESWGDGPDSYTQGQTWYFDTGDSQRQVLAFYERLLPGA